MLIDIRYGGGGSIIKGVIFHADRYQVRGRGIYNKGGRIPYRYQVRGGHSIIKGVYVPYKINI